MDVPCISVSLVMFEVLGVVDKYCGFSVSEELIAVAVGLGLGLVGV